MAFNIYQKRKDLNLTLEEIAKFVGVSKSTVKKWESGDIKNMRRDKIIKLATILKVSPVDILQPNIKSNTENIQSLVLTDSLSKKLTDLLTSAFKSAPEGPCAIVVKGEKLTLITPPNIIFDFIK